MRNFRKPHDPKALPRCIYKRKYKSGVIFYRVIMHHNKAKYHVGYFLTLEEAIKRRDEWKPRMKSFRTQTP